MRNQNGRFTADHDTVERRVRALRLRSAGASYRAIAADLGVNPSTAYRLVQSTYAELVTEAGADALALELDRLDADLLALNRTAAKVTTALQDLDPADDRAVLPTLATLASAVARLTEAKGRISERRARLRGLDQPHRVQVETGASLPVTAVLERVVAAVQPWPDAAAAVGLVLLDLADDLAARPDDDPDDDPADGVPV